MCWKMKKKAKVKVEKQNRRLCGKNWKWMTVVKVGKKVKIYGRNYTRIN